MIGRSGTPHLIFRADAGFEIGIGHVMRCLALANAAKSRGATCGFLLRDIPGQLADRVADEGHDVYLIESSRTGVASDEPVLAHSKWLPGGQRNDAQLCKSLLHTTADWIVADHYALDRTWQNEMRDCARYLAAIDDLADRFHEVDVLVDPNPMRQDSAEYEAHTTKATAMCLGGDYAILRPEFAQLRQSSLNWRSGRSASHMRIAIMFGGTDPDNGTGKVLMALASKDMPVSSIEVIVGSRSCHLDAVREQVLKVGDHVRLHVDTQDVASLLARSDICIGAAGSGAWERCCLGVPSLLVALAPNQRDIVAHLSEAGAARLLTDLDAETIQEAVRGLTTSSLQSMAKVGAGMVDGLGADRVLDIMQETARS